MLSNSSKKPLNKSILLPLEAKQASTRWNKKFFEKMFSLNIYFKKLLLVAVKPGEIRENGFH